MAGQSEMIPYAVFSDFRGGLDARRMPINGVPGTLQTATNVLVSRGGELVKRMAFVPQITLPAGTFGLWSCAGNLYTFGSATAPTMPNGVIYQQLVHPTGATMQRLVDAANFAGKIYAVAQFVDGSIHHFYDGAIIPFWRDGTYADASPANFPNQINNNIQLAAYLAAVIDASPAYSARAQVNSVIVSAQVPGTAFTYSASVASGGTGTTIAVNLVTANVAASAGSQAVATMTVASGYNAATDYVTGITAGPTGPQLLGAPVAWQGNAADTATAIATQINRWGSQFSATATGAVVSITGPMIGTALNGTELVATVDGQMTLGAMTSFMGGSGAVAPVAQVVQFDIDGPYTEAAVYQILVGSLTATKAATLTSKGTVIKAHRQKIYAGNQSVMEFCAINSPTYWTPLATGDTTNPPGAGFVDLATNGFGSDPITAISTLNQYLVFFAQHGVQVWSIDPDPAKNALAQPIENMGTRFTHSVQPFGGMDIGVLFLHDSGIRAIKPQMITGYVSANDAGFPVDPLITADLAALNQTDINNIRSLVTPKDYAYWLSIGSKIYVLSYHPNAQIQAWSVFQPGFTVDSMVVNDQQVWVRDTNNQLYLYGGTDGNTYDSCPVEVATQFVDGGSPSAFKRLQSFDAAVLGTWDVEVMVDPRKNKVVQRIGQIDESTFRGGAVTVTARCNHMALRFTSAYPGPATISSAILHFDPQNVS